MTWAHATRRTSACVCGVCVYLLTIAICVHVCLSVWKLSVCLRVCVCVGVRGCVRERGVGTFESVNRRERDGGMEGGRCREVFSPTHPHTHMHASTHTHECDRIAARQCVSGEVSGWVSASLAGCLKSIRGRFCPAERRIHPHAHCTRTPAHIWLDRHTRHFFCLLPPACLS